MSKKACLLGDFAVGKTSMVRRFVYNLFDDRYISTIGVKVSRKTVAIPSDDQLVELTLMLWDLAGSEEFDRFRSSYLRGASGALLVCDVTRPETLDNLQRYAEDLLAISPEARLVIAANKSDLLAQPAGPGSRLSADRVRALADRLGAQFFLTSALTGDMVEDSFRALGRRLINR